MFRYEDIPVQLILQFLQDLLHPFKGEPAPELAHVQVIALDGCATQGIGHFSGGVGRDKRIAIPVTTGPEPHPDHGPLFIRCLGELVLEKVDDPAAGVVEHILQVPDHAHRLIIRRGLLLLEERCFTELLQVGIYPVHVILPDGTGQVIDDPQYGAGIELGGMGGKYQPDRKIRKFPGEFRVVPFQHYMGFKMFEGARTRHVIHLGECRILQCIEQDHLPLHILHETEHQVQLLLLLLVGRMPSEEILQYLSRAHLLAIPVLTVGQKQGEQDACFLDPMEGERSEEAVV